MHAAQLQEREQERVIGLLQAKMDSDNARLAQLKRQGQEVAARVARLQQQLDSMLPPSAATGAGGLRTGEGGVALPGAAPTAADANATGSPSNEALRPSTAALQTAQALLCGVRLSLSASLGFRATDVPPRNEPGKEPLTLREAFVARQPAEAGPQQLLRSLTLIGGEVIRCESRRASRAVAQELLDSFAAHEFLADDAISCALDAADVLGQPVVACKYVYVGPDVKDVSELGPSDHVIKVPKPGGGDWLGGDLRPDLRQQLLRAHWRTPKGCEVRRRSGSCELACVSCAGARWHPVVWGGRTRASAPAAAR